MSCFSTIFLQNIRVHSVSGCAVSLWVAKAVMCLLLALAPVFFVRAQDANAKIETRVFEFHFRLNSGDFEPNLLENSATSDSLSAFLRSLGKDGVLGAEVVAFASPEGTYSRNIVLCEERAGAFASLVGVRFPQLSGKLSSSAGGEAWEDLRSRLDQDSRLRELSPEKYHQICDILDSPSLSEDERKVALRSSLEDNWYGYLRWIHYRYLRRCEVRVSYMADALPAVAEKKDTVFVSRVDTVYVVVRDTVYVNRDGLQDQLDEKLIEQKEVVKKKPLAAVKTNLLFDAVSMLNYAIEVPVGKRFSLVWEHYFPWWIFNSNRICVQYLTLGGEVRWWFAPKPIRASERFQERDRLVGHYFGVYGFWGKTDLQWDTIGCYQCESIVSTGITYGFSFPLTRHLNMELSASVGYARIPYQHYIPSSDWKTLWKDNNDNGITHYFGPTKLQVSLIWPILVNYRVREGAAR